LYGLLPQDYELELKKKYKKVEDNLTLIQSAGLTAEQQIMVQKFIEGSFKESVQLSGEQRQLDYLSIILNQSSLGNNSTTNINNSSTHYSYMSSA
jgi:hypothetical protein